MENPRVDPHRYFQMIFDKAPENLNMVRKFFTISDIAKLDKCKEN